MNIKLALSVKDIAGLRSAEQGIQKNVRSILLQVGKNVELTDEIVYGGKVQVCGLRTLHSLQLYIQ